MESSLVRLKPARRDPPAVLAIAAHPDDIEFVMAGTLLLLQQRGWETHYFNLASGNNGSLQHDGPTTRRMRRREARTAARILGAQFHPPIADDLEIFYTLRLLRQVAAVVREVQPAIVLTHSPLDYMEDHTNASRLAVSAAFTRGMPNFKTLPHRVAAAYDTTVYHALPHGMCDQLRQRIAPGSFVNTSAVHATKLAALKAHQSQQHWLEASQGMNSYLRAMEEMSLAVGRLSKRFQHAEGWRRHSHYGYAGSAVDPLGDALGGDYFVNTAYERALRRGHCPSQA
jgi:LmbE family N-acetylglucosaminyl deacetylase